MKETRIQPILVPVDFSEESKRALLFANDLSNREQCPLVVLHVIHDNGGGGELHRNRTKDDLLLPIHDVAERTMREFISTLCNEATDQDALESAETIIVDGLPVNRILEVARKINAKHIVVGGNERGSLSRILNGSVSQSIAKDSSVPVTIFHQRNQTGSS